MEDYFSDLGYVLNSETNTYESTDKPSIKINFLGLQNSNIINENTLKFIPPVPDAGVTTSTFWESPLSKFIIYISVMWWSLDGTDGGGYVG